MSSSVGPEYYVSIMSFVDKTQARGGAARSAWLGEARDSALNPRARLSPLCTLHPTRI